MRISDWSSDVCASDLDLGEGEVDQRAIMGVADELRDLRGIDRPKQRFGLGIVMRLDQTVGERRVDGLRQRFAGGHRGACSADIRSEEHTSELQSLMRTSYAVFCLKKQKQNILMTQHTHTRHTTEYNY